MCRLQQLFPIDGKDRNPADKGIQEAEENGGTADVFGAFGKGTVAEGMIIYHGLDRGINEFHDEHQDEAGYEDEVLNETEFEDKRERQQDRCEDDFLTEGAFVLEGRTETFEGINESVEDALEAAFAFMGTGLVFHGSIITMLLGAENRATKKPADDSGRLGGGNFRSELLGKLKGAFDDSGEGAGFKGCPADEATVDVGLREQIIRIFRLHGTPVKDTNLIGSLCSKEGG